MPSASVGTAPATSIASGGVRSAGFTRKTGVRGDGGAPGSSSQTLTCSTVLGGVAAAVGSPASGSPAACTVVTTPFLSVATDGPQHGLFTPAEPPAPSSHENE